MNAHVKRVAALIAGWALILLGIAGLFLPLLQGVLFLLMGLTILSTQYQWAHRWMTKLRRRFPRLSAAATRVLTRASAWWQRLFR